MTETPDPTSPSTHRDVSSNRVFRTTLLWSAAITAGLAVAGALIGFAVAGTSGLWSALIAILLAAVFLSLTAGTILIANRWYGDPLYVPIFFGAVMGGWIVKFALFIVVLLVLRGQPWLNGTVFFVARRERRGIPHHRCRRDAEDARPVRGRREPAHPLRHHRRGPSPVPAASAAGRGWYRQ